MIVDTQFKFIILIFYYILNIRASVLPIKDNVTNVSKSKVKFNIDPEGCAAIEDQCMKDPVMPNEFTLLACFIKTVHVNRNIVPEKCHHHIWTHQYQLLQNRYLRSKLFMACSTEPLIAKCFQVTMYEDTFALDCVLKRKSSVKTKDCMQTIELIENVTFNDWQITKKFLKFCMDDIQRESCGRVPLDPRSLSQKDTVTCLQNKENSLRTECKYEMTALLAMKYSSQQLDKIVFVACAMEQDRFCPEVAPGTWFMYKCLQKHKQESDMTKKCQDELFFNQRMIVFNYKMSKGLVKSCKDDIRKYKCRKNVAEDKEVRLAQILLCLENVARNESAVLSKECSAEMSDHRKMLMEDYRLSPELMQNCANDIATLCPGAERGGKTIHCLMEFARPNKEKDKRISAACEKSLEALVESADPGEDWRVDPVLRNACKPVVDRACREVIGGNGRVMSCLMEKLGTVLMSSECETALMQIQYFISRNFKLDPQLFRACKYDAVTRCHAKLNWADDVPISEKDPLIFPCLYNFAYNPDSKGLLKSSCEAQVRRVMRQRAMSVDLMPEIEDACLEDLANRCFEKMGRGEEISCLQTKLNELSEKCRIAIYNFTDIQSGRVELNSVVNNYCRVPIERLCSSELNSNKDDGDVMECLILHKNNIIIKGNSRCKAAIDHVQLISLKNYRFTRKFKNACRSYVIRFCPKALVKNEVVACLSEIVRNDTISRRKHTIPKDCRQQLRSQLFQQKENIDLDPELKEACKGDLEVHCAGIPHGEAAALECLQTAKTKLTDGCKKAIFIVKKQEFTDNGVDYHLVTTCNNMIDLYCHNTEPSRILDCLKAHREEAGFNEECKVVVINRLIEQNSDYRFNNNLQNACKLDIKKFCKNVLINEPQDVEFEGKVLYCLKEKFRESKLTSTCENELAVVLKEQALNYRLDPLLGKLCKAEIQTICTGPNDSLTNSDGKVEECLKNALLARKIVSAECAREVVQIIEETEVDIDADPLLERACALDLLKYCKDLEHGAGRRLKCLKIILNDSDRKLETDCQKQLSSRLEMYKYVASVNVVENLGDVYNEISSSPSKKYFLVVGISILGLMFIMGLYCGRITKRAMYIKRK